MKYKMPTYAKFSIMGRLGAVPQVMTTTKNGRQSKFVPLSLAIDNSRKGPDGTFIKQTSWMRFSINNEFFIKDFENGPQWQKGDLIAVEGSIVARENVAPDGKRTTVHYFNPNEIYNTSAVYRRKLDKASTGDGQTKHAPEPIPLTDDFDISGDGFDLGGPGDKPLAF